MAERNALVMEHSKLNMRRSGVFHELFKNRFYYLLALPAILLVFIFCYLPLPGIVLAFKDFNYKAGIFGSKFVGLENFKFYFTSEAAFRTTFNTLFINANYIIFGTAFSVGFALIINELRSNVFKRIYQSLMFLPYFISAIIVANIVYMIFSESYGVANEIVTMFGGQSIAWYQEPKYWVPILVMVNIWKSTGYGLIIYLATIVGIDEELFEAAKMDGATKLQQIIFITLPLLVPTISILTLLSIGRMFYGDFSTIYPIINTQGLLFPTTDIIDTYVFRSVKDLGQIGMPAAVGLYQSICGFVLVLGSNLLAKKIDNAESLF